VHTEKVVPCYPARVKPQWESEGLLAILAECPTCHRKQSIRNKACKCGQSMDSAKRSKKVRYWVNYRLPDGKQKRESVDAFKDLNGYSIEDARKAESKRVVQKAENRIMDIKPDAKMTFQALADWYLDLEKVKALRSLKRTKIKLKNFNKVFGILIVSRIKPLDLENYQMRRKAEGSADGTIDIELTGAQAMINKAFDNDLVGGNTLRVFKKVKKLLKANGNARDRILTPLEYKGLMKHAASHLKPIIAMGYHTGMRLGEILNLTWEKMDLINRVISLEAEDTKDGEPREVPIPEELFSILKAIPYPIHTEYVFLYNGQPVGETRESLKTACDKADIPYGQKVKGGFVFHDLRHTFNTNMRKAGVNESVIMAITGHSTRAMFDGYKTVDSDDKQQAVDQMQSFLANVDQTVDQGGFGNVNHLDLLQT
jgi:integrase